MDVISQASFKYGPVPAALTALSALPLTAGLLRLVEVAGGSGVLKARMTSRRVSECPRRTYHRRRNDS